MASRVVGDEDVMERIVDHLGDLELSRVSRVSRGARDATEAERRARRNRAVGVQRSRGLLKTWRPLLDETCELVGRLVADARCQVYRRWTEDELRVSLRLDGDPHYWQILSIRCEVLERRYPHVVYDVGLDSVRDITELCATGSIKNYRKDVKRIEVIPSCEKSAGRRHCVHGLGCRVRWAGTVRCSYRDSVVHEAGYSSCMCMLGGEPLIVFMMATAEEWKGLTEENEVAWLHALVESVGI
jgi:hypothetical protein